MSPEMAFSTTASRQILITGATKGIGRALAIELAGDAVCRHRIAICGRDETALRQMTALKLPVEWVDASIVDVTSESAVKEWCVRLNEMNFVPDLLVNNAGVLSRKETFYNTPKAEFDTVIDVNVKGAANVMRVFLPSMIKAHRGVIVNMSSAWGRSTAPHVSAYCASKYAIEGLSKAVAMEVPEPIAVIPLAPGIIETNMTRSIFESSDVSKMQSPESWACRAAPFLLKLTREHNGTSLSVPSPTSDVPL